MANTISTLEVVVMSVDRINIDTIIIIMVTLGKLEFVPSTKQTTKIHCPYINVDELRSLLIEQSRARDLEGKLLEKAPVIDV